MIKCNYNPPFWEKGRGGGLTGPFKNYRGHVVLTGILIDNYKYCGGIRCRKERNLTWTLKSAVLKDSIDAAGIPTGDVAHLVLLHWK